MVARWLEKGQRGRAPFRWLLPRGGSTVDQQALDCSGRHRVLARPLTFMRRAKPCFLRATRAPTRHKLDIAPEEGMDVYRERVGMKLEAGKVAVVTGAASGIGLALSERFARNGLHVVLAGVNQSTLASAADKIGALGVETLVGSYRCERPSSGGGVGGCRDRALRVGARGV